MRLGGRPLAGRITPNQKRDCYMSRVTATDVEQIDFVYAPELPLTLEQRIEVLELQAAEMREQILALVECLRPGGEPDPLPSGVAISP